MKIRRRITALVLTAVLTASTFLTACGGNTGGGSTTSQQSEAPAASTASEAGGNDVAADDSDTGRPLGVALIVNGNIGDKSFNDLAYAGMQRAVDDLGVNAKLVENSYDTTKYEPSIIEFAENPDYDVIICNSYDVKEIVEKIAPQFPEKHFILYDADLDFSLGLENCYSMTYKQNEASFLAGAMASRLTSSGIDRTNEEKLIGYIAGGENTIINDFLMGYIEGCEYADPETKMFISYVGDFQNTPKGKEMGLAMYMQNADVIFQVAAAAGLGVLEAAKEKDAFVIGVDTDQYTLFTESDPEQAEAIITSVVKRVDDTIYTCIQRANDGTLPWGEHEVQGLKEGAVGLAQNDYYKSVVPQDIQDFVAETEAKISSGEIVVGTTIGMPTDAINEVRNRIKPE